VANQLISAGADAFTYDCQVGEQVLGWVGAVFHFLFLADVLLEAGLWRWLATGGAVLNLIVTTTVLQSTLDAGRGNRAVPVLRFRGSEIARP
jgi:hypothetical protein